MFFIYLKILLGFQYDNNLVNKFVTINLIQNV